PGTFGNNIRIQVAAAEEPCRIDHELYTNAFDRLTYMPIFPSPQNQLRVTRGASRRTDTFNLLYRSIVQDERVTPGDGGRFFLARKPIIEVPTVNPIRLPNSDGTVARESGDGSILDGEGAPPHVGEIRIVNQAGTTEILFEATQVPTARQTVVA